VLLLKILFISDIMGKPGRWVISQQLRDFQEQNQIDFTIANVENAAGGFGVTEQISRKIFAYGVNVQTSGNHIWDRQEIREYLSTYPLLLRPANYPAGAPGSGVHVEKLLDGRSIAVVNLQGRVSMPAIDCPFRTADGCLSMIGDQTKIIIVDMHAEATSEKKALATYLDGRVSAVLGTHTHVQTADEQILAKGTAFISDAGMTGPHDSIIGMKHDAALKRFLFGMPYRFSCAIGDIRMQGVILDIDDQTGKTRSIERYSIKAPEGSSEYLEGNEGR
jgi:metallophosphoesterase (TIGR00282 family)